MATTEQLARRVEKLGEIATGQPHVVFTMVEGKTEMERQQQVAANLAARGIDASDPTLHVIAFRLVAPGDVENNQDQSRCQA